MGRRTKIDAAIAALEKMGAQPEGYRGNGRSASNPNAPLCPTHGTPMKPSKHGGGWYCTQKIADDDGTGKPAYCRQRIKAKQPEAESEKRFPAAPYRIGCGHGSVLSRPSKPARRPLSPA